MPLRQDALRPKPARMIKPELFVRNCEFPDCPNHRGLWRSLLEPQHGYTLEGRWYCTPECFENSAALAIRKLLAGMAKPPGKSHRIPLGLLMLSRGIVDQEQLKRALQAQKDSGGGRVGEWLRHIGAVSEEQVTQILGLQYSAAVFPLERSRRYLDCAQMVPFLLLEAAEMIPVHHLPASRHLYVAFGDRINHSALYALEKMLACRTEPCLAVKSQLQKALEDLRNAPRETEVLGGEASDPEEMAGTIFDHAESQSSTDVKISGFDGFVWVRLISPRTHTDLLFRIPKKTSVITMDLTR